MYGSVVLSSVDLNDEVIRPTTTTHPTRLNFSFPFLSSPCGKRKKNETNNDEPKQNEKDPNAMAVGPPANDITAPPISGGIGMIPTGLMRSSSGAGGGGGGFDRGRSVVVVFFVSGGRWRQGRRMVAVRRKQFINRHCRLLIFFF